MSRIATLSVAVSASPLPSAFRLFKAGWNDTEKGRVLFDETAARAVMAAFGAHGVDRMIDLEHMSLDQESVNFDPDARGWCRLEVRKGELWAIGVSWTSDGARRLRDKLQRYVSPAFEIDLDTRRVRKVVNIAITALPATHGIAALVAASARTRSIMAKEIGEPLPDGLNDAQKKRLRSVLEELIAADAPVGSIRAFVEQLLGELAPDTDGAVEAAARRHGVTRDQIAAMRDQAKRLGQRVTVATVERFAEVRRAMGRP